MADEKREILIKWLADATAVMKANQEIQQEALKTNQILKGAMGEAELATMSFSAQVDKARVALLQLMNQGHSLKSSMQGLKETQTFDTAAIAEAGKSITAVDSATKQTTKSLSAMGNVAQRVFRSIMGFVVLGILRQLITAFGELIDKGKEFTRALVNLSVAARAAQRSGLDVTFEDLLKVIDRLQEKFGIFTSQELRSGIDQLIIFGKETDLTKNQLLELSDAIAAAAVVTGVSFETAINRVMRALTTGQTKGLLEAGFAITELMVKEEAYSEGLAERGKALSDAAKQQAIYNLVMEQSSKVEEEAAAVQDTLVGGLLKEEAAMSDLQDTLGSKLIPGKLFLLKVGGQLLTWLDQAIVAFTQLAAVSLPVVGAAVWVATEALIHFWKALAGESSPMSLEEIKARYIEIRDVMLEMALANAEQVLSPQGLEGLNVGEVIQDEAQSVSDAGDELTDELEDLYTKLRETIISGQQNTAKENRDFFQDMIKSMQKFIFKMQQLSEKYTFDIAKVWRDYRDRLADVDKKYRQKEIKAEEDFQDKMKKLRNKFLMDLEEALEERDARQILRLIRDFNRRAQELEDDREREKRIRGRAWEDEKADLAKQRDEKLRELSLEHQFRTRQLAQQYEFERKLAQQEHENRLKELAIQTKERLEKIVRQFKDEHDITKEGAKLVADALSEYFGPNGQIEQIYAGLIASTDNFILAFHERIQHMLQMFQLLKNPLEGSSTPTTTPVPTPVSRGGSSGISSLRLPENPGVASTSPLPTNNISSAVPLSSSTIADSGAMKIEVVLSPDLEARVIDQTKTEIADVFVQVTK